jgi:hypothetical protein
VVISTGDADCIRSPNGASSLYNSRMFRRIVLFVLLSLAVASPAAAAKPPAILYALDATRATVVDARHLSLPAAARVTWFADRPQRTSGMTTLRNLQEIWAASGFVKDPPNAALILTGGGKTRTHVVELSRPRYRDGRVVFRMRRVPGAVEAGRVDRDAIVAGAYARAALFIDDAAAPPCPYPLVVTGTGLCLLGQEDPLEILVRNPTAMAHVVMCSSVSGSGGFVAMTNGVSVMTGPCDQYSDANYVFGPPTNNASETFTYFGSMGGGPITVQYTLNFPAWAARGGS